VFFYIPNANKDLTVFYRWNKTATYPAPAFRNYNETKDNLITANGTVAGYMVAGYHYDTPENTRGALS